MTDKSKKDRLTEKGLKPGFGDKPKPKRIKVKAFAATRDSGDGSWGVFYFTTKAKRDEFIELSNQSGWGMAEEGSFDLVVDEKGKIVKGSDDDYLEEFRESVQQKLSKN